MIQKVFKTLAQSLRLFNGPWLLLPAIPVVVLHRYGLDWTTSLTDATVSCIILVLLGTVVSLVYRYYQPGRESRIYRPVFPIAMTAIFYFLMSSLPGIFLPDSPEYIQFLKASMPVRSFIALMAFGSIAVFNRIHYQLLDQKESEKRNQESEQRLKEAELTRLRQQLHPHFLFNSLNSINALIGTQPEAARKMTQQLSDFLRGTLRQEDKPVRLREELDQLRLYLEIEKVRFGSRLQVDFDLAPESLDAFLPVLVLQPILENAIKFGLYDLVEEVHISLRSRIATGYLVVEITNPFDPETSTGSRGSGFGLSSVHRRLQLIFGREDLLSTSVGGNTFNTVLKIPFPS